MSRGHRSWTHDAMTEAPGRKNDAHLSSVPGGEGGAAKIGEVFLPYYPLIRYFLRGTHPSRAYAVWRGVHNG